MTLAVSIITIAGTGRAYLPEAMKSLLRQTLGDWESIVLDCGSEEVSAIVQSQMSALVDPRIRVVRYDTDTRFPPHAAKKWNFGVSQARGDFIAFLDDDDMKEDEWLEEMCRPLMNDPALMTTLCGGYNIDMEGKKCGRLFGEPSFDTTTLLSPSFVTTGQMVVRRTVFDEIGGFDESLLCAEDWEFCIRLSKYPWRHISNTSCLKRDSRSNACYHPEVGGYTQDALRKTIRKHGLAPEICHDCQQGFIEGDEPFVWAVSGLGFRFWHYGCAVRKQQGS